jgi:hypothetical protein
MAKAYRTDVVSKKKFQEEIEQRRNALKPESVPCPLPGCDCTYEMYGYRLVWYGFDFLWIVGNSEATPQLVINPDWRMRARCG